MILDHLSFSPFTLGETRFPAMGCIVTLWRDVCDKNWGPQSMILEFDFGTESFSSTQILRRLLLQLTSILNLLKKAWPISTHQVVIRLPILMLHEKKLRVASCFILGWIFFILLKMLRARMLHIIWTTVKCTFSWLATQKSKYGHFRSKFLLCNYPALDFWIIKWPSFLNSL